MTVESRVSQLWQERTRTVVRAGVVGELVAGNTVNLFVIANAPIIASMFGVITAVMDANATTVQLRNNLTVMSLASGALNGQLVGIHLNPTGAVGVAIAIGAGVLVGVHQPTNRWSLSPGTINILVGGVTNVTGAITWYITYEPTSALVTVV